MFKAMTWLFMWVCIPLDYLLWNIFMGSSHGYKTLNECFDDNYRFWKELNP